MSNEPEQGSQPPEDGYTWEQPQEPQGNAGWDQPPYGVDPQQGYQPYDPNTPPWQQPYGPPYQDQWGQPPGGGWIPPGPPAPLKHSRWGIAALVCGALGTISFIILQIVGPMVASFEPGTIPQNPTGGDVALGMASCCSFLMIGVSLLLAVIGCFDKSSNRITAFVALGVLGVVTCCLGGLIALGAAVVLGGLK